jgi:hypothetical protein
MRCFWHISHTILLSYTWWERRGWPRVWLGCTVENVIEARRRIPILLRTPACIHWLACEPLLGPLDLGPWLGSGDQLDHRQRRERRQTRPIYGAGLGA